MKFDELLKLPQYSLPQAEKEQILLEGLNGLDAHHRLHCPEYERLVSVLWPDFRKARALAELPYLAVGLFKSHRLSSIPKEKVFKTLTSSGTTGQQVSQIFLDVETAQRQSASLSRIMTHVLGPNRLPMLIVESRALLQDRKRFSARAAGVLGMMTFGRDHFYALDENMELDEAGLAAFLEKFGGKPFFLFGFTFMIWQYLFQRIGDRKMDLSQGILVHGGGWKKLQELAVSNSEFKRKFREKTGLSRIYNFYGLVEQVGSIYVEGDNGYLYAPNYADVIVRDPITWEPAPIGTPGVLQVLSLLPTSYPGHSVLTEDLGVIHGIDDPRGGRYGKYFSVLGRIPKAELRGCSDVHASQVSG
ncbi:MAG: acyl-protein synthetase [Candidatus Acidiferrales bacterium]